MDLAQAIVALGALLVIYLIFKTREPVPFHIQWPLQCSKGWRGQTLQQPSLTTGGSVQCYCPANFQLLGHEIAATQNGIDRAIKAAARAQVQWATTTFRERKRVLRTLQRFIVDHQDEICNVACLDTGKTKVDALFGEILVTCAKIEWTLAHGEDALRPDARPTSLLMFYKTNKVCYEPMGVVGACVSWNYPFHNLLGPVISALFTGNAIVVKNSEQTAWSSRIFCSIAAAALSACGHSEDLVKSITCWPETANHFTSHPGIAHLTFIGSRPVAQKVCASAAKALIPVVVELGGKDSAIILDDPSGQEIGQAEMDRIASIVMRGVFQSAGQNCVGIERVIAMPRAYARLEKILSVRIGALRVGDPQTEEVDVGAMISSAGFETLEKHIAEAVSDGARLIHGGRQHKSSGHFFQPTMIVDVTPEMHLAQHEVFGPICVMLRASSVEDAIKISNSTSFGLGCSVFGPVQTAAARAALTKVVEQTKTGMVAVNDFAAYYMVQLPFGGVKHSGYGRFAGAEGLRGLCNTKSVCRDRWPRLIKTSIPRGLDYPMRDTAWNMGKGVVELAYGTSWKTRWQGMWKLLR